MDDDLGEGGTRRTEYAQEISSGGAILQLLSFVLDQLRGNPAHLGPVFSKFHHPAKGILVKNPGDEARRDKLEGIYQEQASLGGRPKRFKAVKGCLENGSRTKRERGGGTAPKTRI